MFPYEIVSASAMRFLLENDQSSALFSDESQDDELFRGGVRIITTTDGRYWTTSTDRQRSRRLVFRHSDELEGCSAAQRRILLERAFSFFERARTPRSIIIPDGWHGWGDDAKFTFYGAPKGRIASRLKWVARVDLEDGDVLFWEVHSADSAPLLKDVEIDLADYYRLVGGWDQVLAAADALATAASASPIVAGTIELAGPALGVGGRGSTYSDWIEHLNEDQLQFVHSPADTSVRLKGPAGSGKTLALELKALHEARDLVRAGEVPRILFATHSWSMAEQIGEDLHRLDEDGVSEFIAALPLLEVARDLGPGDRIGAGVSVLGDDSEEGREFQRIQLEEVLRAFLASDWISYASDVSPNLASALGASLDGSDDSLAFINDLITEFSVVLGGEGIMDGPEDERRYVTMPRGPWSMSLDSAIDRKAVYFVYRRFLRSLSSEGFLTSDQFLKDFLDFLRGFVWNSQRILVGYDLVFVDELHLFNPQERGILSHLNRDSTRYPRLFMALDPRQSTTGRFGAGAEAGEDAATTFVLTDVYRFTPQILELVKHINAWLPTEDFGDEWHVDITQARSDLPPGPKPTLFRASAVGGHLVAAFQKAEEALRRSTRVAIVIVDESGLGAYLSAADALSERPGHNVIVIRTRDDLGVLSYASKGLVVGWTNDVAGLQFDEVIVTCLGDPGMIEAREHRRQTFMSTLYLAVSRARERVTLVVDEDADAIPSVLDSALTAGVISLG